MASRSSSQKVDWQIAEDITTRVHYLIDCISEIDWVDKHSIKCVRSFNATARAYARIWGLPRVWQLALNLKPHYTIEILSERFDHLPQRRKDEILLHEIAHIPKTFSGALLPHTRKRKGNFHDKLKGLIAAYDRL